MTVRSSVSRTVDAVLEASVVGSFSKIGFVVRSRLDGWSEPANAKGRTIVVTGATSGLGLATAERLAFLGATVHVVGRNEVKIEAALDRIRRVALGEVQGHRCDLSLLADTAALSEDLTRSGAPIDVLIHNAGALLPAYTATSEGVETTVATHLLSPYLLTERLVSSNSLSSDARVITMTSGGMYTERFDLATLEMGPTDYKGTIAYARAKRAQSVLSAHWQATYGPRGLAFHLVHPGWAATPGVSEGIPGFSKVMGPLLRTPTQGADTTVWLAGSPQGEPAPGNLWLDRRARPLHRLRRTRLTDEQQSQAETQLPRWCDDRIARALAEGG